MKRNSLKTEFKICAPQLRNFRQRHQTLILCNLSQTDHLILIRNIAVTSSSQDAAYFPRQDATARKKITNPPSNGTSTHFRFLHRFPFFPFDSFDSFVCIPTLDACQRKFRGISRTQTSSRGNSSPEETKKRNYRKGVAMGGCLAFEGERCSIMLDIINLNVWDVEDSVYEFFYAIIFCLVSCLKYLSTSGPLPDHTLTYSTAARR